MREVVNFKKCRCAYWTVLRPNGSPDPPSLDDRLEKGLFACRSPGETPRLIFAAEGCNIEASQLNPLPNICHFPLTAKIKKATRPCEISPRRAQVDIIKLRLVQLVHEFLLLVLLNLFRHPSGRLAEHPVQAACHAFLPLFVSGYGSFCLVA